MKSLLENWYLEQIQGELSIFAQACKQNNNGKYFYNFFSIEEY